MAFNRAVRPDARAGGDHRIRRDALRERLSVLNVKLHKASRDALPIAKASVRMPYEKSNDAYLSKPLISSTNKCGRNDDGNQQVRVNFTRGQNSGRRNRNKGEVLGNDFLNFGANRCFRAHRGDTS